MSKSMAMSTVHLLKVMKPQGKRHHSHNSMSFGQLKCEFQTQQRLNSDTRRGVKALNLRLLEWGRGGRWRLWIKLQHSTLPSKTIRVAKIQEIINFLWVSRHEIFTFSWVLNNTSPSHSDMHLLLLLLRFNRTYKWDLYKYLHDDWGGTTLFAIGAKLLLETVSPGPSMH